MKFLDFGKVAVSENYGQRRDRIVLEMFPFSLRSLWLSSGFSFVLILIQIFLDKGKIFGIVGNYKVRKFS